MSPYVSLSFANVPIPLTPESIRGNIKFPFPFEIYGIPDYAMDPAHAIRVYQAIHMFRDSYARLT